jgi:hypothetical protein
MLSQQQLITLLPLTSAVFFAGYQVNRIDELFTKVHASAKETAETRDVILDIHGRVCGIEQHIKNIDSKLEK